MEQDIVIELMKQTDIADVPETYRPIANIIGINNLVKICQYCNGDELYFPMADTILRNARNRNIKISYTGSNTKELALKYNLTKKQIMNIVFRK